MRRTIWPLMLSLLVGCPEPEPEPEPEPTPEPAPAGGIVDDVVLNLVTLNQGVAVALMSEGVTPGAQRGHRGGEARLAAGLRGSRGWLRGAGSWSRS